MSVYYEVRRLLLFALILRQSVVSQSVEVFLLLFAKQCVCLVQSESRRFLHLRLCGCGHFDFFLNYLLYDFFYRYFFDNFLFDDFLNLYRNFYLDFFLDNLFDLDRHLYYFLYWYLNDLLHYLFDGDFFFDYLFDDLRLRHCRQFQNLLHQQFLIFHHLLYSFVVVI